MLNHSPAVSWTGSVYGDAASAHDATLVRLPRSGDLGSRVVKRPSYNSFLFLCLALNPHSFVVAAASLADMSQAHKIFCVDSVYAR